MWPDEGSRLELSRLAAEIRTECGGRAVNAPDIHLTLLFLGAVAAPRIAAVRAAAETIIATPFRLAIDRLEYWRHNRIAWAGARLCPPELYALVAQLEAAMAPQGFPRENRSYVPHLTLVRDARQASCRVAAPALEWIAGDFALVQSGVSHQSRYETLARWAMRA